MRIAYFDSFSGAGGDMIVASLLDAGADLEFIRAGLAGLAVQGYRFHVEGTRKQGIAATRFHVEIDNPSSQPHRHLKDIRAVLEQSTLSPMIRDQAEKIFLRLAEAEARVHGTAVENVHFHEVGAVDAIVDVVGALLALENLGVERIRCSPPVVGSGTVRFSHGELPVPAPAVAELLKGVPLTSCDEPGELLTPTAAAVLTTLADGFGPWPSMTVRSVGYGAGTRDGMRRPNVLRVVIGDTVASGEHGGEAEADVDEIVVLETNVDDASPQVLGHCMERLLHEGALDVFAVPIHMKKSRIGVLLTVLCEPARAEAMEDILFVETPTFGIRRHSATRAILRRRFETVRTPYGDIRVKIGRRGNVETATPEYEDCRQAAQKHGVSLREVLAAVHQASGGQRTARAKPVRTQSPNSGSPASFTRGP